MLNQKCGGGEGKANCSRWQAALRMAGSPADGRPGDGEGLPEVGFGSRDTQSYTPRASCHLKCLLWGLGEMEGI